MSYLLRINSVYYVRVVVPPDLRAHFTTRELKRSLRTRQLTEARRMAPTILSGIMSTFRDLRAGIMTKQPIITAEAVAIFRRLYPGADTHETVEVTRGVPPWVVHEGYREVPTPPLVKIQERLDEGWQVDESGDWVFVGVGAQRVPTAPPVAPAPSPTSAKVLSLVPKPALTLHKAGALWLKHLEAPEDTVHYKPAKPATIDSSKQALKQLERWQGKDTAIEALLDLDYKPFTVFMMTTGSKLGKGSAKTRLRFSKFFFKWLKDFGYTDREPTIIYPKLQGTEKVKTANLPYTNKELNSFFDYIMNNTPVNMRDRKNQLSLAYLILMFIYTGFRSSEQTSFTKAKIKKTDDGLRYFDFNEMTKDNVASIRMVPVHSKLVELGFMQFAKKQKDKIFNVDVSNYRKRHTEILKALGMKGGRNEKTFHSCRATFDSKLAGKVEDSTRKILMGHTHTGMDSLYVHQLADEMPMYRDAVEKLDYRLDFARLREYLVNEVSVLYPRRGYEEVVPLVLD